MDLGMAFEAYGNSVLNAIITALLRGLYVIRLDLYATEAVTNATPPMAARQQIRDLISIERHQFS
jgi:hypothetical protein